MPVSDLDPTQAHEYAEISIPAQQLENAFVEIGVREKGNRFFDFGIGSALSFLDEGDEGG